MALDGMKLSAHSSRTPLLAGAVMLLALAVPGNCGPIKLERTGWHWTAYGRFLEDFRLTNTSEKPICYTGYASPVCFKELWTLAWWRRQRLSLCGNGLREGGLEPGQSTTFGYPPPEGSKTWRIGVSYDWGSKDDVFQEYPLKVKSAGIVTTSPRDQIFASAPDASKLVRLEVQKQTGQEERYTFTLTNTSAQTLFYGGYREKSVPPIYLSQLSQRFGWKYDGTVDWSGTGLGFKEIRPGATIQFSIPARGGEHIWRIGLRLFRTNAPRAMEDAYRPVWWPKLPPRDKKF